MDHAVKLWRLPVTTGDRIAREDKPLFSTCILHDAQVLSVTWYETRFTIIAYVILRIRRMNKDMLISNCGKVILMTEGSRSLYTEPATLILWKWLGLERFFPPDRDVWPALQRGCASVSRVIYFND